MFTHCGLPKPGVSVESQTIIFLAYGTQLLRLRGKASLKLPMEKLVQN